MIAMWQKVLGVTVTPNPVDYNTLLSKGLDNGLFEPYASPGLTSIDRAFDLIAQNGRGRIALFGLAFKGGTDDLRESPLVTLSERLIGKGYELRIFDPEFPDRAVVAAGAPWFMTLFGRDSLITAPRASV